MKIRQFSSFFTVLYLALGLSAKAQSKNDIVGTWLNTEKTAHIEIFPVSDEYQGKIVWMLNPYSNGKPALDTQNSNLRLKTRPLVGLTILDGLKYEKGIWKDGQIYDPTSGKTYSCELKLQSEDVLEVKGFLGFSFVGKTVEWTRVK